MIIAVIRARRTADRHDRQIGTAPCGLSAHTLLADTIEKRYFTMIPLSQIPVSKSTVPPFFSDSLIIV
jgi:hypothetical protein